MGCLAEAPPGFRVLFPGSLVSLLFRRSLLSGTVKGVTVHSFLRHLCMCVELSPTPKSRAVVWGYSSAPESPPVP